MTEFREIADRVWLAHSPGYDVGVGLVGGDAGLVVIDTGASPELAADLLTAVRRISRAPLVAAVNTHAHAAHVGGNATFAAAGAELVAHELTAATLGGTGAGVPTRTFSSALALDLGDRVLEVVHPGRGHTDGDVVLRVPDTDLIFTGDLVEESTAHSVVPGLGPDCFPMDWPASLDLVLGLTGADTVFVPGHGNPVDQDFVYEQRAALGVVAETIRDLAGRGVPLDQALAAAEWPYPREEMADAVRRGYEQLPRVRRQLPLI